MSKREYQCRAVYLGQLHTCIETASNEDDAKRGAAERWECEPNDIEIVEVKTWMKNEDMLAGLVKLTASDLHYRDGQQVAVVQIREYMPYPIEFCNVRLDNGRLYLENHKGGVWTEQSVHQGTIEVYGRVGK